MTAQSVACLAQQKNVVDNYKQTSQVPHRDNVMQPAGLLCRLQFELCRYYQIQYTAVLIKKSPNTMPGV
ncbi:hypothetical protein EB796_005914 [Bugula neritina]|uniref:Uncharacterized protein n=1 Tax=Bugula neritina TaxID=10212 RepID=A0A7J7KAV2_BUGNE|nr:hypothetical protein EB796_005914 [Bugula neritina]